MPNPQTSPSPSTIITHLSSFLLLAAIALWANHQSSHLPFSIVVPSSSSSPHFDLHFASNGRASSTIFRAASLIDPILFPNPFLFPRKPVDQISLHLSPYNNLSTISIESVAKRFTIILGSGIPMEAMTDALTKGVARVLLWDGGGEAPSEVIEALGDYLSVVTTREVVVMREVKREGKCIGEVEFVEYCERRRPGFVARLNRGMREGWSEEVVDEALGFSTRSACAEYRRWRQGLQDGKEA